MGNNLQKNNYHEIIEVSHIDNDNLHACYNNQTAHPAGKNATNIA